MFASSIYYILIEYILYSHRAYTIFSSSIYYILFELTLLSPVEKGCVGINISQRTLYHYLSISQLRGHPGAARSKKKRKEKVGGACKCANFDCSFYSLFFQISNHLSKSEAIYLEKGEGASKRQRKK